MKCPVCKTYDLVMTEKQGVEIDYCPNCRGIWLDRGELEKLVERSAAYEQQWQQRPPQQPPASVPPQQSVQPMNQPPAHSSSQPGYPQGQPGYPQQPYYYDDDDDRHHPQHPHGKKRKGFLGEVFDIFD